MRISSLSLILDGEQITVSSLTLRFTAWPE